MSSIHDMIDRGLSFMTGAMSTGAADSIDGRLTDMNDDVLKHDDTIFQWQLGKYGPSGLTGRKPDSDLIANEQYFYVNWKKWIDTWNETKKAAEKSLETARSFAGGAGADLVAEIDRAIDRKKIELAAWKTRFTEIKVAHEKAEAAGKAPAKNEGAPPAEFPWGKVLLGGVAIIGAGLAITSYMKYRTKRELEAAAAASVPTPPSRRLPPPPMPYVPSSGMYRATSPIPATQRKTVTLGVPSCPLTLLDSIQAQNSSRNTLVSGSAPKTLPSGPPSSMEPATLAQV